MNPPSQSEPVTGPDEDTEFGQVCNNQVCGPFSFLGFLPRFLICSDDHQPILTVFVMVFLFPDSFPLTWPEHPTCFHLV
jgi:hypothetical protein